MLKKFLCLVWLIFPLFSIAQLRENQKTIVKNGNYSFLFEEYESAIESYSKALISDPENANLNYKIGLCYLNMPDIASNIKSIPYLEKATKQISKFYLESYPNFRKAPFDTWYLLGNAYRLQTRFDDAYRCYQNYLSIAPKKNKELIAYVKREQQKCMNAKEIIRFPKELHKLTLGKNLSGSKDIQSCPVMSADGSILVYCIGEKNLFPPDFNLSRENENYQMDDVYYSQKVNGQWSKPENIMNNLKSKGLTVPVCLSSDGKTLFLVRDDNDNGNIYVSERKDSRWTAMKKLNKKINSRFWETHAFISSDGKELYFTSDRRGGFGGFDIYKSTKTKENDWGKPVNLGSKINTPFDEETPFLEDNNKTLYFSSQGHFGMGGFDVFCSVLSDSGWTEPLNVGYPINTIGNDLVYVTKIDTELAYALQNSVELHNPNGNQNDLYSRQLPTKNNVPQVTIKGTLLASNGLINSEKMSKLQIVDSLSAEKTIPIQSVVIDNNYSLVIPAGDHRIIYKIPGYTNHTEILHLPPLFGYNELTLNINLEPHEELLVSMQDSIKLYSDKNDSLSKFADINNNQHNINILTKSESYIICDMLFGFDNSQTDQYNSNLDSLANYLKQHPGAVIQLTGYADAVGDENYNLALSRRRAQFIKNQLLSRGVNSNSIKIACKGESNPIASNGTAESRAYNRRVEISIVSDPDSKLMVNPIKVPEEMKTKKLPS